MLFSAMSSHIPAGPAVAAPVVPAVQPSLPDLGWGHQPALPPPVGMQTTAGLDHFRVSRAWTGVPQMLATYIEEQPQERSLSQLLQAELMYLRFAEMGTPMFYDADVNVNTWYVFDRRWRSAKDKVVHVVGLCKVYLLPELYGALKYAKANRLFPDNADGEEHPRLTFLIKTTAAVENVGQLERIIRESQIFFKKTPEFDANPDLFQGENFVLDLRTNAFRRPTAADMCRRASPIVIPETWLSDPSLIAAEAAPLMKRAADIIWSISEPSPRPSFNLYIIGGQFAAMPQPSKCVVRPW